MHMTTEGLKKMAAHSVAALREGTSLNDSITKVAMDNEMNSDQVKRMVETTNQMAYLSELDGQDDRTFEFDVANYDDILNGMLPSSGMDKAASETDVINPMDLVTGSFQSLEKVAQEKEATIEKWGKNQKLQALKKVASQQRNRLDEMESAEYDNLVKIAQHRAIICRDPDALLKMAKFDNGIQMSQVVFGHEKVATEVRQVWHPEELQDIKSFSDRLTMCKQAQAEKLELKAKVEEAEGILKEAFVAAAMNAAKSSFSGNAGKVSSSPGMAKAKKAYGAFDTVDSTNEVRKGTKKNHDAWSSLRG